jgi:predicted TIM-barrel fold metal-dependent hydrolase
MSEQAAEPVVDADVHPSTRAAYEDLKQYLSSGWRERLALYSNVLGGLRGPAVPLPSKERSARFVGHDGSRPGSDPELARSQLFDGAGIDYAILVPLESLYVSEIVSVNETLQLAAAYNDYFVDNWVRADSRFGLSIVASPQNPRVAAKEIERWAEQPGVVAVVLPLIDVLMGKPHYRPIFGAAEAAGLPIVTHSGHTPYEGTPTYGGGAPSDYVQRHCLVGEIAMSNVVSLVLEGTFERYPGLTVVFSGFGFSWLPHVLWRLDQTWNQLPASVRSVSALPSDVVRRHIRLTTGSEEKPSVPGDFARVWELSFGEETLMYGSDYPHWQNGSPVDALVELPSTARRSALGERALQTFEKAATALANVRTVV